MRPPAFEFVNVTAGYRGAPAIEQVHLRVEPGELVGIVGPSGCGKSTILRLIAGLGQATSGNIYFGDKIVNNVSAGDRNVAMVFQNYALYPHMTVEKNITYALHAHKVPKSEIAERLSEALSMLRLEGLEKRKPKELSGGQRQRVALARAIVKRSKYFLLDEPLSNLDARLRHHARKELLKIHQHFLHTFIYVTHDQVEAMTLGERVALMNEGKLQMIDTPENIFNKPANVFTAKFIGSPSCNTVSAAYENKGLRVNGDFVPLDLAWQSQIEKSGTNDLILGLRPEHIKLLREPTSDTVRVKITSIENYGSQSGAYFFLIGEEWVAITKDNRFKVGDIAYFKPDERKIHLFNSATTNSIGYPEIYSNIENEVTAFEICS